MKLYAPAYYNDFACIADRCRHSCCIGWEIDVDPETMEKYRALKEGYGATVLETVEGEVPHFRLCEGERCPHLDENGLCRIIINLSEDHLCHICRSHPRFYNDTRAGREAGLGLCCEEAARLILSSDLYGEMICIGETDEEDDPPAFDALPFRARIFARLEDESLPYTERLRLIGEELGVSPLRYGDGEWRELLSGLEYLCDSSREAFLAYTSDPETPREAEKLLERALAYFVYRHVSAAESEEELCASLGFALFCERLLCSLIKESGPFEFEKAADLARLISEELEYSEENTEVVKLEFMFF